MKIYEVGGTVRDSLLGLPVADRDWVVVDGDAAELEALGYRRVGRDFPVFLHPDTGEEYALARTERKIGRGHGGFEFDTSRNVTLEEDLSRRDLTINAIARDSDGTLIDPYGGQRDLADRVLRHVSPAFREDPLRVLRVARFHARFHGLGFRIAAATLDLMRNIAASGEIDTLPPERVWAETVKALATRDPGVYVETLRACGTLAVLFPELDRLFGVPQPERWHPEIDTGVHTLMALDVCAQLTRDPVVRFAVLVHDLGKGTTPADELPRHHGHERRSVELIDGLCARLRVPKRFVTLARHVAAHHTKMHRIGNLTPSRLHDLLAELGAFREPARLEAFLIACEADARGRTGFGDVPYDQGDALRACLEAALSVTSAAVPPGTEPGAPFGRALRRLRIDAITACRASPDPGAVTAARTR